MYGFLDLLGDLGGVTEILAICFGFMLYPFSEHFFILDATKQIFMAKTKDEKMFLPTKKEDYQIDHIQNLMKDRMTLEELKTHRYMKIKLKDKLLLYAKKNLGCTCVRRFWKNHSKFEKIYEKGQKRIDSELNIVKFMNNLRNVKILLKASLMKDPEVKMQVKHNKKNLIMLDDDEDTSNEPKLVKTLTSMMKKKMLGQSQGKKVDILSSIVQGSSAKLENGEVSHEFSGDEEGEKKPENSSSQLRLLQTSATPPDLVALEERRTGAANSPTFNDREQLDLEEQILKEAKIK